MSIHPFANNQFLTLVGIIKHEVCKKVEQTDYNFPKIPIANSVGFHFCYCSLNQIDTIKVV